jgi:spermidine synthase
MASASRLVAMTVMPGQRLRGVRSIVDVGGGQGRLLRTILDAHPQIERAVLFDQALVDGSH